jgi:hypothetical protein
MLASMSPLFSIIVLASLTLMVGCDRTEVRTSTNATPPETSASASSPEPASPELTSSPTTIRAADAAGRELEVPYVTTPMEIVDKILEMGKVDREDVLYDLGSGDGRIVIRAAQKYGTRGIGYDLDPARIKESNEAAEKAGVTDLVQFIQQDIFDVDLSGATVVTLYLLPEVNLRLRPKLLRELKAGSRVVSHNYGMGDWKEEEVAEFHIDGETHYATVWVMPPPISTSESDAPAAP